MEQPGLLARLKAAFVPIIEKYSAVSSWIGNGFGPIKESFSGAWQRNITASAGPSILASSSVYSCVNIISSDIAKLDIKVTGPAKDGGREEQLNSPYTYLLNAPNGFQTMFEFMCHFMCSKLINGNAYIWMMRDGRGVVNEMYVLDPLKVTPQIADDGSIFYSLGEDKIVGVKGQIIIPARDIIHSKMATMQHSLMGVSPLYAAGVSAMMGARILMNSETFFGNMSRPSGTLETPNAMKPEDTIALRDSFEKNYSRDGNGRTAVLTNGLQYKSLSITAADSQLIDQLKWTVTDVARVYRVPLFLLNEMQGTQYKNTEAMMSAYYTGCLQAHIKQIEQSFERAFQLPTGQRVEFDLTALFRMETDVRYAAYKVAIGCGLLSINEARSFEGLKPVDGGEEPRVQMQYIPLSADVTQVNQNTAPTSSADTANQNVDEEPQDDTNSDNEDAQQRDFDKEALVKVLTDSFIKRLKERASNVKQ